MKKLYKITDVGKGQTVLTPKNLRRIDNDYSFGEVIQDNIIELLKDGTVVSSVDLTALLASAGGPVGLEHQAFNIPGKLSDSSNNALLFGGKFQNTLITIDHLELVDQHFTKIINEGPFTITFQADGPNATNLINSGGLTLNVGQYAEVYRKFNQNVVYLRIY